MPRALHNSESSSHVMQIWRLAKAARQPARCLLSHLVHVYHPAEADAEGKQVGAGRDTATSKQSEHQ